jgi:Flp pilus assembly protein TadD
MLFLALALILYQGQTVSTETIFNQATRALTAGDYAAAESSFREVLRREPNNLGALGNLGVLYSRQNLPAKAVEIYQRALKLMPGEPGLRLNLGLAFLKLDDYAKAKPLFAQLAATPSARQLQARELHAICQLQTGEVSAATATLEELLRLPQPAPGVYHFLALAYVKQRETGKAQQVLDQLLARLPAAQAHYLEGRVWYDATLFDRALASFEKSAAANGNLPGLALELGKTQISLRNYSEAASHLRKALEQVPSDIEARYFLGALLVQQGEHQEGAPLLAAVRTARPDLWGTSYYLGKAQLAMGKPALALPLLQEAARRAPNEAPVQYQLARALQALGRKAEAKTAFARVSQLQASANSESILMR